MAFAASTLARVINENAAYGYYDNTQPHEFIGESMMSVTAEMEYGIMSEAAEFMDLAAAADDILAEAAMTAPDRYEVLQENVLTNIKNGILKFWKKIKEFVKGLIEKLKAAFYRLTGKTDKWVSLMKPKISEAGRRAGSSEFKYTTYAFDEKYITSDLSGNLDAIMSEWDGEMGNIVKDVDQMQANVNSYKGMLTRHEAGPMPNMNPTKTDRDIGTRMEADRKKANADAQEWGKTDNHDEVKPDDDKAKQFVDEEEKKQEADQRAFEDWEEKFPEKIGKYFGINGATSMESLWSDVKEKAHGGTTEKTEQTVGSKANTMLSAIESSKKTIDSIKKAYEGHLRTLTKYEAAIEKGGYDAKIKDESKNKIPGNVATAINDGYKNKYTYMMKKTQAYESAMNNARQTNIQLIEEMVGNYMSALTAFAGYKEPKKS